MKPLSLKMRAIALLAQREHSLIELRGKLLRLARARAAERLAQAQAAADEAAGAEAWAGVESESDAETPEAEVEALLIWLQARGYLDESRFVESRVHARAPRYGNRRIQQELAQHGLSLDAEAQARLKDSELVRAREVWQRKFGERPPEDAAARAKQTRFLVGRGFSAEVVRRVLRYPDD